MILRIIVVKYHLFSFVKAGIIEEMMEDTMEMVEDVEELEEDVQKEVDKILHEITSDKIKGAPKIPETPIDLPEPEQEEETVPEETEEELEEMRERLQALRS